MTDGCERHDENTVTIYVSTGRPRPTRREDQSCVARDVAGWRDVLTFITSSNTPKRLTQGFRAALARRVSDGHGGSLFELIEEPRQASE